MSGRLKIIAIGFNMPGTGLTRVMHSIVGRLADDLEIHYLGIGFKGEIVRDRGLTIYPTNPKGGDVFAAFQAKRMIEEIHPGLVFILHDIWMFNHYLQVLGPFRPQTRIVPYIPLDGKLVNELDAAPLENCDTIAAYTEFARDQFEGAFKRLVNSGAGENFPPVEVVPHGVDRERFFPLPNLIRESFASVGRAAAKREVFTDLPQPETAFVVLNASRPDIRKRLDLTLEGFARFAAGKPGNVKLCLHHAVSGSPEEDEVASLIECFGLKDRVYLNPLGQRTLTDTELNLLYNACDVGINTSMGEGWGLVSFEHGAAGSAQIVPNHSACGAIWPGRAELIEPVRSYVPEFSVLEMAEVSVEGVAKALEDLYRDPDHRQHMGKAAFEFAQDPAYSWDSIAEQFAQLFVRVAGQ